MVRFQYLTIDTLAKVFSSSFQVVPMRSSNVDDSLYLGHGVEKYFDIEKVTTVHESLLQLIACYSCS